MIVSASHDYKPYVSSPPLQFGHQHTDPGLVSPVRVFDQHGTNLLGQDPPIRTRHKRIEKAGRRGQLKNPGRSRLRSLLSLL
jgi:hypothetical protein